MFSFLFFFNDTATTEIYTLSLHDALPIFALHAAVAAALADRLVDHDPSGAHGDRAPLDRKSTRLNSSHPSISYAVFCLKKKKKQLCVYTGITLEFPRHLGHHDSVVFCSRA